MKATVGPPPTPVEREVTLTMTQSQALLLRGIVGSMSLRQWEDLKDHSGPWYFAAHGATARDGYNLGVEIHAALGCVPRS
jgi:hypothetical protein